MDSDFASIVVDGSTDSSVTEQELVYLRTSKDGVLSTNFLTICAIDKATAVNIHAALLTTISQELEVTSQQFMKKLAGVGTDGAPVMLGKKGGLVALLKQQQPCLVGIHCMAHRLELALKKTVNSFPMFAAIEQLMLDLYMFYHYSPLNRSNLKIAYKTMPDLPVLMPTRVGGTRWVSHLKTALDHAFRGYEAIVTHLSNSADSGSDSSHKTQATAKGLAKKLTSKAVFINGHFLWDVVNILSKLSLTLQTKTLTLADVHIAVDSSMCALNKMHSKDGLMLRRVKDLNNYGGFPLKDSSGELSDIRKGFLEGLEAQLRDRFSDIDEGLLSATSLLDLKSWPTTKDELNTFGDDHIESLIDHFSPILSDAGIDCGSIETEWTYLKKSKSVNCTSWQALFASCVQNNKNVMALINLLLTLPATSAVCEQGFSQMKKVKNDWRSQLTNESLAELMRVKIESPSVIDFDPAAALQLWQCGGLRSRRPGIKMYKPRKTRTPPSDSDSSPWSDFEEDNLLE